MAKSARMKFDESRIGSDSEGRRSRNRSGARRSLTGAAAAHATRYCGCRCCSSLGQAGKGGPYRPSRYNVSDAHHCGHRMNDQTTTVTGAPKGVRKVVTAPTRHPIAWRDPFRRKCPVQLERVYDLYMAAVAASACTVSLAVRAIDSAPSMTRYGRQEIYWEVAGHCCLCDMCYMTKCPYVPPHPGTSTA
jgi:hypothetical protein